MSDQIDIEQLVKDFLEYYSEFEGASLCNPADMRIALNDALSFVNETFWGEYSYSNYIASDKAKGVFSYAAHKLLCRLKAKRQVDSNIIPESMSAIKSTSNGKDSITKTPVQHQTALASQLDSTQYGQDFLGLREKLESQDDIFVGLMV